MMAIFNPLVSPMFKYFILVMFFPLTAISEENTRIDDILNFYQITETIGTGGQPKPDQFISIRDAGFTSVINLAMPDSPNALINEGEIVTKLGMTYIHIPVPWQSPSIQDLERFMGFMETLEKQKIFVHCAANYRASAFTNRHLRLNDNLSEEKATSPILRQWLPEMDENWKKIINYKG